jgi:hypothetical protein
MSGTLQVGRTSRLGVTWLGHDVGVNPLLDHARAERAPSDLTMYLGRWAPGPRPPDAHRPVVEAAGQPLRHRLLRPLAAAEMFGSWLTARALRASGCGRAERRQSAELKMSRKGGDAETAMAGRTVEYQSNGLARSASTPSGITKSLTCVRKSRWLEFGDLTPQGSAWNRVDVVEVHDALGWHAIGGSQHELRDETSDGSRDGRYHDRPDAAGNRVSGHDQDRAVPARRCRKPNLTVLHRPNPTSLRRVPNRRSDRLLTHHR